MKRKFLISEFKWIIIGIALIGFLVFLHITRPPHREIFIVTGGVLILVAFIIVFEYMLYGRANLFPMSFLQKINHLTKTNHELFIHFGSKRIRIELDKVFSAIPAGLDKANSFTYGYQCYFDNEDRYDKKTDSDEAKKNDFESDDDIV
ncbi:MAG: hypothetical protein PHI01_03555, partial [Candidatus Izemoplasmatales bacterium]|nr:hypothetical protein [Candidatus Izemoplasmatales bacterium]